RLPRLLVLFGDLVEVVVLEAVPLVAQPDAEGDGESELLRLVEHRLCVVADAPRAERISAALLEQFLRRAAAGALDEVGLAVAEERPVAGAVGLFQFDARLRRMRCRQSQNDDRCKEAMHRNL